MNFFRRGQRDVAPKQDLKQVTAAPKPVNSEAPRQNRNGAAAYSVLSKKDDIPPHQAVLSIAGGPIELSPEWQKNYAILLINREKKEVAVICTVDSVRKTGLDDDYLAIVDRIKRSGFIRGKTKLLAKPEIIQIIYEQTEQKRSVEEQQKAATKIQLEFDELLISALKAKASDIHIEVTRKGAEVRFRVNGALQSFEEWPVRHARTMAGVIYMVIAEEKDTSFDERREQSAIIDRDLGEWGSVRVRLNTLPNYPAGFDMIMRILKMGQSGEKIDLNKLGYQREQLSKVRRAVAKPVGAIMLAGTTGSGKSTSLNAMLSEKIAHHEGRIKVITVEDPPEYLLVGATQVPVVRSRSAAKDGVEVNPFASTVRAAMRSDPDILMIGEVRDVHSAELLIHAVQSGHQVFSTTHASSGVDIISRLRSNGIPDDVLGSHNFIAGLMYQTLLQTVCPHCSTDFSHFKSMVHDDAGEELVHRVYRYLGSDQSKSLRFINHSGCPHCRNGVTGRTVAAEVILPDAYMLRSFRDRQDSDAMMHYAYNGGKFALHHGIEKMLSGQCDIRDVEHKLDQIAALRELASSVRFFVASSHYAAYIDAQRKSEEDSKLEQTGSQLIIPAESATPAPAIPPELPQAVDPAPAIEVALDQAAVPAETVSSVPANQAVSLTKESAPAFEDIEIAPASEIEITREPVLALGEITPAPLAESLDFELMVPATVEFDPLSEVDSDEQEFELADLIESQSTQATEDLGQAEVQSPAVILTPVKVEQQNEPAPVVLAPVIIASVDKPVEPAPTPQDAKDVVVQTLAVISPEEADVAKGDSLTPKEAVGSTPAETEQEIDVAGIDASSINSKSGAAEFALLNDLLAVLRSEVKRTGISLSGKFFKARLSKTAISALVASDNTPANLGAALQASFDALSADELEKVTATSVDDLQLLIDSVEQEKRDVTVLTTNQSNTSVSKLDTEQAVEAIKPQQKPAKAPRAVTDISQKRAAKEKAPAKPKAPRNYKSKLLSAGLPADDAPATTAKPAKPKAGGNVQSLAEARKRKSPAKKKDASDKGDNE